MVTVGEEQATIGAARGLLEGPVDSFEKLEIVLFLARTPAEPLDVATLVRRTALPHRTIRDAIQDLARAEVVVAVADLGWRVHPHGPWSDAVLAVVDLHNRDRRRLRELMADVALDRLRGGSDSAPALPLGPRKTGDPDE